MLRVAQLVDPALNLTLNKRHNAALTYELFLFAVATRTIDQGH